MNIEFRKRVNWLLVKQNDNSTLVLFQPFTPHGGIRSLAGVLSWKNKKKKTNPKTGVATLSLHY